MATLNLDEGTISDVLHANDIIMILMWDTITKEFLTYHMYGYNTSRREILAHLNKLEEFADCDILQIIK